MPIKYTAHFFIYLMSLVFVDHDNQQRNEIKHRAWITFIQNESDFAAFSGLLQYQCSLSCFLNV